MKIPQSLIALLILSASSALADTDGILHAFYGLDIETQGRKVATVRKSANVILDTPIEINFEGRCKVSLVFGPGQAEGYELIMTIRELRSSSPDIYTLPVNHFYALQLDEQLEFVIQTSHGLTISGAIRLTEVSRFELAI